MAKVKAETRRIKKWRDLESREADIELETEQLLRECGWHHTSSTPGCYWMWLKEWDGKTFMVDTKTAERIQTHWDAAADAKAHPDEYGD